MRASFVLSSTLTLFAAGGFVCAPLAAQNETADAPAGAIEIDYPGFAALTDEVAAIRAERLLTLAQFHARAAEPGTLILDTRSPASFARGHIAGAVNLPFSDFTDEALAQVIGADKGRTILIYCNNNFRDDVPPVVLKRAPLALNIPTFINLVGYGYTNVWELGDTVSIADVEWAGTSAPAPAPALAGDSQRAASAY